MAVSLNKETSEVSLQKEAATESPEAQKNRHLEGVRNALATPIEDIIDGARGAWSPEEAALVRELLERAQDNGHFERQNREMSPEETADFASVMTQYLRNKQESETDSTVAKGLGLQVRGAAELAVAAKAVRDGSAANIREYLDARLEKMSLKPEGQEEFAMTHNGNWGMSGDNRPGYDIYTEERAEAYILLEQIEANPAGARSFVDQVRQGSADPRPPVMPSSSLEM